MAAHGPRWQPERAAPARVMGLPLGTALGAASLPPRPQAPFRRAGLLAKTLLALSPLPPDLACSGDLKGHPGLPDRAYSGGLVNHGRVTWRFSSGRVLRYTRVVNCQLGQASPTAIGSRAKALQVEPDFRRRQCQSSASSIHRYWDWRPRPTRAAWMRAWEQLPPRTFLSSTLSSTPSEGRAAVLCQASAHREARRPWL